MPQVITARFVTIRKPCEGFECPEPATVLTQFVGDCGEPEFSFTCVKCSQWGIDNGFPSWNIVPIPVRVESEE
jgi:hypothetical protein